MNKNLLVLFAFFIAIFSVNAQQCQNLSIEQKDATCTLPTTELTANFLNSKYRESDTYAINLELPCPQEVEEITPSHIVSDDDWSVVYNLGFTFCFYGNMYDQFILNDNGILSFDLDLAGSSTAIWQINGGLNLPTTNWQPNSIFCPFMDTDVRRAPTPEEAISFDILNQDPLIPENVGNRMFVVEFNTPQYGCNNLYLKSKIILYETSNVIDIIITEKDICNHNGGNAVVGIQNKSATRGISPGDASNPNNPYRGNGQWNPTAIQSEGELWRFIPDGETIEYDFQWFADYGNGFQPYSDDATITVNPTEETDYKATLTYQGECATTAINLSATTTVMPHVGVPNVLLPQDYMFFENTLCSGIAEFNINQTTDIMADFDLAHLDLYKVIYYYYEDQDIPTDGIAEVHIIPTANLNAFISPSRTIFVTVEEDCALDFDGDNVFNCVDPDPLVACDVNDPMLDCDNDGLLNIEETSGIDDPATTANPGGNITDPLVPECDPTDYTLDCDGDGLFNRIDPDPLTACDPNDGTQDCDGDGILNAVDTTPTCDSNDCDQDCDNDGIPNCEDVNPSFYDNDSCSATREFNITVESLSTALPQANTLCEDTLDSGVAEFNINQTDAIMANIDPANLALYEVIYYYFEDQNIPLDGDAEVHIIPTADLDAFISPTREIHVTVQLDCALDFDGDNIFNCDDPNPLVACDVTDPNLDCDGDGLSNSEETTGIDDPTTIADPAGNITDPLVAECVVTDCTQDCDGDGLFNCVDPDPLTACDPTDGTQDCDGDGILNAVDTSPTCDPFNCDQDCDGDGVPNCEDINPSYYNNNTCASANFTITVNPLHDSTFTYPQTDYCSDDLNPLVNQPLTTLGGTFTIEPQTVGDPNGTINDITGEIDLIETPTGTYIITYTTEPDVNPDPTGDVWPDCSTSDTFIITINQTPTAQIVAPVTECDSYILRNLNTGNNYYTGTNGSGTMMNAGDEITSTITLYIYAESGTTPNCSDQSTFVVTIINSPVAGIPTELSDCDNGDGTANIDISSLASEIMDGQNVILTYHQSFQDADDAINPLLTTPYIRTYGAVWARIENSNGCYDVIAVPLVVEDCYVTIPTGFSPSSNIPENTTFNIRNIRDMFPHYKLYIYNRFGKEIYVGDANTDDWNGKLQNEGSILPTGTYFYGLRLHDELELKYRGWVYLQQ